MSLEAMLRTCRERKGLAYTLCIEGVRRYLREKPKRRIIREIMEISEIGLLRILWSAGLDAEMQRAALKRMKELMAKKT